MEKYGVQVRVKPEVEELVRELSAYLGYLPYTVRNTALLYGLSIMAFKGIPESDEEFVKLVNLVKAFVGGRRGQR